MLKVYRLTKARPRLEDPRAVLWVKAVGPAEARIIAKVAFDELAPQRGGPSQLSVWMSPDLSNCEVDASVEIPAGYAIRQADGTLTKAP